MSQKIVTRLLLLCESGNRLCFSYRDTSFGRRTNREMMYLHGLVSIFSRFILSPFNDTQPFSCIATLEIYSCQHQNFFFNEALSSLLGHCISNSNVIKPICFSLISPIYGEEIYCSIRFVYVDISMSLYVRRLVTEVM